MTSPSAPTYGGQALVEGVLIRSAERWAVALRTPVGQIHTYDGALRPAGGLWRLPLLRGLHALGVQLRLGMRALTDSSTLADTGQIQPISLLATAGLVAVSLVIGLFVFSAVPLWVTGREPSVEPTLVQRLSEGLVKGLFLAIYVVGVTRIGRYRRIFSYHGAEHMAIACAESELPLTAANVSRFSPTHPRCGTGFLVILAAVDTLLLAATPRLGPVADLVLRIGFVPVSAAIAYELLRWGSRRRGIGFALNRFGLLTQRLTTAPPDAGQIEVAIAAVERCQPGRWRRPPEPIDSQDLPRLGGHPEGCRIQPVLKGTTDGTDRTPAGDHDPDSRGAAPLSIEAQGVAGRPGHRRHAYHLRRRQRLRGKPHAEREQLGGSQRRRIGQHLRRDGPRLPG